MEKKRGEGSSGLLRISRGIIYQKALVPCGTAVAAGICIINIGEYMDSVEFTTYMLTFCGGKEIFLKNNRGTKVEVPAKTLYDLNIFPFHVRYQILVHQFHRIKY